MQKRVLCLLVDGFEEIELATPVDVLRRAGAEVVVAGLNGMTASGKCGMKVQADQMLAALDPAGFDLLLIPGGPGVGELRNDGRAAKLAREFSDRGLWVAAICAAPLVLLDAGILAGKRFTAYHSVRAELGGCQDQRVVVDGRLITSRGPGTAMDFSLAIVTELFGAEAAVSVAGEMMC